MESTELLFGFPFKAMVSPMSSLLTCYYNANCLLYYWRINVLFKISLPPFCIFLTDTGTAQLPTQLPLKQVGKSRIFHQLKMRCTSGLKICLNRILFFSWLLTLKNESGDFSIGGWRKQRRKLSWKLTACFAKGTLEWGIRGWSQSWLLWDQ